MRHLLLVALFTSALVNFYLGAELLTSIDEVAALNKVLKERSAEEERALNTYRKLSVELQAMLGSALSAAEKSVGQTALCLKQKREERASMQKFTHDVLRSFMRGEQPCEDAGDGAIVCPESRI